MNNTDHMRISRTEHSSVILKPRCLKPTGHYLYTPELGRLGCVISIQKGVNCDAYPVSFSQKVTKNLPVSFYIPTPGFNQTKYFKTLKNDAQKA